MLNLTSGTWLTPADSNRYIWTHQLLVVVPWNVNPNHLDSAALWITGGGNGDGNPSAYDEDVLVCASLATSTGTVCSVLYQVPNQPVVFSADPEKKQRSEDAAVAFTWVQYMVYHPDQPDWIIYFPMARAAVKAMDAVRIEMLLCSFVGSIMSLRCCRPKSSSPPSTLVITSRSGWLWVQASADGPPGWSAHLLASACSVSLQLLWTCSYVPRSMHLNE